MSRAWAAILGAGLALCGSAAALRPTNDFQLAEELTRRVDALDLELKGLSTLQASYPGRCSDPALAAERARLVEGLRRRTQTLSDVLKEYFALRERNDFIAIGLAGAALKRRGASADDSVKKVAQLFARKDVGEQVRQFRDSTEKALADDDRAFQDAQETCRRERRRRTAGLALLALAVLLSGGLWLYWKRTINRERGP